MTRVFKFDGTNISGTIMISTINQVKMLGDIGVKILKEVNIKDIDANKYYPRTIRGEIHQKLLESYGDIALYNLGVEQFIQAQDTAIFSGSFNTFFRVPAPHASCKIVRP